MHGIISILAMVTTIGLIGLPSPYLPYLSLPYPILPYPTLPYLTFPYPTLPYPTLPFLTLPFLTPPYLTLPYPSLPCLSLPACMISCRESHLSFPFSPWLQVSSLPRGFLLFYKYFSTKSNHCLIFFQLAVFSYRHYGRSLYLCCHYLYITVIFQIICHFQISRVWRDHLLSRRSREAGSPGPSIHLPWERVRSMDHVCCQISVNFVTIIIYYGSNFTEFNPESGLFTAYLKWTL